MSFETLASWTLRIRPPEQYDPKAIYALSEKLSASIEF